MKANLTVIIVIALLFIGATNFSPHIRIGSDGFYFTSAGVGDTVGTLLNSRLTVDTIDNKYVPHASMRFADSAVVFDLTEDVEYMVTNATDSLFRKIEFDDGITYSGDTIKLNDAMGHYFATGHLSFIGGASAANYELKIHCNGIVIGSYYTNTTNNTGYVTVSFGDLYLDDTCPNLYITITNLTNSNDVTVIGGGVYINLIHE